MSEPRARMAVSADAPGTAEAADLIARQGGNVVDAAVAAGLAATVAEVLMCSLGGSAFLMLRLPGQRPVLIDGSDTMPRVPPRPVEGDSLRRVHLAYGDGIEVVVGHGSVAVPGLLAAFETAWRRYGSLPWAEVVAPAIELARRGCPVGPPLGRWLEIAGESIFGRQQASRLCFFPDGHRGLRCGEHFVIPHMAETLEVVAREGARALYEGDLGAAFAAEMEEQGGYVGRKDLAAYRAAVREPLALHSRGYELALNPPPAVGGAAVGSLLALLETRWDSTGGSAEQALLQARAQRYLLRMREDTFNIPGFDASSYSRLIEPDMLLHHGRALASPNTTHLSVASVDGGLAAVTMSNGYGSGITIPGTGIVCNNSLGEPELNPQGFFASTPGTRMVSNMAPTIALRDDGLGWALGSPGASRITTAIAQTWVGLAFERKAIEEAVESPRLHVEIWDDGNRAQCEPGLDVSMLSAEFDVRAFEQRDMFFGAVKLAGIRQNGELCAVADDRREGATRVV